MFAKARQRHSLSTFLSLMQTSLFASFHVMQQHVESHATVAAVSCATVDFATIVCPARRSLSSPYAMLL